MPAANPYSILERNRYFEVVGLLNRENRSDYKATMFSEVDMSRIEGLRSAAGADKASYSAYMIEAIVQGLKLHPHCNRLTWEIPFFRRLVQLHAYDISVAIEKELPGHDQVVHVDCIRGADRKSPVELTQVLKRFSEADLNSSENFRLFRRIVEKIPFRRLAAMILSAPRLLPSLWIRHRGGAVLLSSPAKYGVDIVAAAWPWPIGFSFGLVKERPAAVDGQVVVRKTMFVTLSFDRRMIGGAQAARFFRTVCQALESGC